MSFDLIDTHLGAVLEISFKITNNLLIAEQTKTIGPTLPKIFTNTLSSYPQYPLMLLIAILSKLYFLLT
jgi:hypothetical protein